jgi:glycosyltransferase involved in cell wall biosynthesis
VVENAAAADSETNEQQTQLRVLYLLKTSPLDEGGGGERRARAITERLAEQGHDVTFLSGTTAPGLDRHDEVGGCSVRHVRCAPDALLRRDGVLSFLLPRYLFAVAFLPAFVSLLRNGEFDIVVEGVTPYPTVAAPLARLFGVPTVAVVHEVHDSDAYDTYDPLTATILLGVQRLLRLFDYAAVVTPTEHGRRALVEFGLQANRVATVPNGIDAERYRRPEVSRDAGRVVTVGRLARRKGHEQVLRAFATLRDRPPAGVPAETLTLDIVGAGPDRERLERLAADLDVTDSVRFHGFVDEERKVELLNRAAVFAFGSRKEGFGIALLEAMAAGTPVVARECPVYHAFFEDGAHGRLVDSDPASMAEALDELLADPERRRELGEGARERAHEFDWDSAADETEHVLRTVVVDGRPDLSAESLAAAVDDRPTDKR